MGVVNTLSTTISNRDASPVVRTPALNQGGMVQEVAETIEVASGDSSTSVFRFFSVPSNARMSYLKLYSDDIGTTTIASFGLYDTTLNGSAVVDVDFFKATQTLKDGAVAGTDICFGNVLTAEKLDKPIWEALGLTSDPGKEYDVCATLTADSDAAGTIALIGGFVK
jgi:hypothetical protein